MRSYYLTVSVNQEPGHSLTGHLWLQVSHEVVGKLSARSVSSSDGLTEKGSAAKLTHVTAGFRASLALSRSPPSVPIHRAAPTVWPAPLRGS